MTHHICSQFESLATAFIDTSSIIYLEKIEVLELLSSTIHLVTIEEIFKEAQKNYSYITLWNCNAFSTNTDRRLIESAVKNRLPLISEDKKILAAMSKHGIPYYNTLMMLIFLLYKNKISHTAFLHTYEKLRTFARYHETVWNYGRQIYAVMYTSPASQRNPV